MIRNKLLLATATAVLLGSGAAHAFFGNTAPPADDAKQRMPTVQAARYGLPDFTELVEKASPAVVSIRVTHLMQTAAPVLPPGFQQGDPLFEFFRRFGQPWSDDRPPIAKGEGSGFIITSDGYILTNAHVVANAEEVNVMLADRRELKATVVGIDEPSDVAVIKIDATGLPYLTIGDPDRLAVGEWVVAIGSPFGFDHTVSAGVVSAKTRSLPDGGSVPFIQTDVAINPGNSGGPLLNLEGEVVGMNSQIYSRNGGYMGLSFAIPIDVAMNIEHQLVNYGKVTRGRIGVIVQSLNQDLADSFGLDRPQGALVSEVQGGTPAAKAELKAGDVILTVNGETVDDSAALSRLIADTKPGESVKLHLIRDHKPKDLRVVVGEMPADQLAQTENGSSPQVPGRLGVVVRPLDESDRESVGEEHGLMVEQSGGAAARAGIRPGDVILAVNNQPVSEPGQLKSLIDRSGDQVAVLVKRNDGTVYIPVKLG
jgi:serine protease Do